MLITLKEWSIRNFEEGSRPCARTLRRWVDQGRLSTTPTRIGNRYYVEVDTQPIGKSRSDLGKRGVS